jgi:DNA-directed RNA polymerase subunit beta'
VPRDTIEIPIKHSFIEGLNALEYFNSSYGARKGMADTATKTSKAGYMTRKLVDAVQEVTIVEEDCGTTKGLVTTALVDEKENRVIESLAERIVNRFANENIKHPKTGEIIVNQGAIITPENAQLIQKLGIKAVEVRSVLHCKSKYGVCAKCFGNDLTTNKQIELHTAIGVIAAQSIGEPGTQLNMRTFHTGGTASAEGNLAQGFQRLAELFGVVPPK